MSWERWLSFHFSFDLNYLLIGKQNEQILYFHVAQIQNYLCLRLLNFLLSRFTCNSQNSSRFLTCVVILVPESVFCWVTLLHRFDWQRVNLLLLVLIICKMISCQYIHSLLNIPDDSRPVFSLGFSVVWTKIFTWDVYWGTFQSTDSLFHIIHSQAGFVSSTWQMKAETVLLLKFIFTHF